MRKMMVSCKTAGELTEKRSYEKLTFKESLRHSYHVKMCEACKSYEHHSAFLDQAIKHLVDKKYKSQVLSVERRQSILKSFQ